MLEVKNLKKNFGKTKVLKKIDFKIEKGDRLAIIGPSGCGKSTILRCINQLEVPSSGEIIFEGKNILENTDMTKIRRKIGMVFQQFNLFENLTVLDNITLAPIKLKIMSKEEAEIKAKKLLKSIGLENKKDNYPNELSGGQKQRVAIIRTLIMNPDIILFDEPTSALGPEMVEEVEQLIKQIAEDGMTMIIVSHEMNFVRNCANKLLFIDEGKVSFYGTVEEAYNNKDNEKLTNFLNIVR
ncbi:MAG: amino acid ABC transporter ATP-binding protein [Bacilli bacterium]|nr:amino acid ABC transporter ATP-binding protein [Bacilli bacterium]